MRAITELVENIPGISSSMIFHKLLPLPSRPALELEVTGMCSGTGTLALQKDKHDCSDDRDEVEREVHEVAYYSRRTVFSERLFDDFFCMC